MSATARASWRRGRALQTIAALMLLAGALRLAGADIASARDAVAAGGQPGPEATADACAQPPDIAALIAALNDRAARLDAREAAIADRMQALHLAEQAAEARLAELEAADAALRDTLTIASSAAEADVARLTAVYENMKPRQAAELFATMAPEFAAGFLARMRPEAAAAVMEGLDIDIAWEISAILAGRNAAAPRQ